MVTFVGPKIRSIVLMASLLPACGRILGIERAHVDPIFEDGTSGDQTDSSDDETDTVEVHDTDDAATEADHDASAGSNETHETTTDDTTNECVSFDNRRVQRLSSDGTLTPLPALDDTAR